MDEEKELKNEETREEMLCRHRQEMKELRNKEIALKKAAAKGSKAEQKAKKKQVDEEISSLLSQLESKHSKELSSLVNNNNKDTGKTDLDTLVMAIAGASITPNKEPFKPSKAARRREKRAQEEAAREQRIEEEQINGVSDRMIENKLLEKKLEPLNLTINEIKPDGNCLYRAVENQLLLHPTKTPKNYTYQELRAMAAKYMREHSKDFIPFFLSESNIEDEDEKSVLTRFEKYCDEIESTSAWGGQLELGALTHCLKKHIVILSGSFPDVEMGEEYKSEDERSIMLSYHRHAYGLGEHYNSIIPMEAVSTCS